MIFRRLRCLIRSKHYNLREVLLKYVTMKLRKLRVFSYVQIDLSVLGFKKICQIYDVA